MNWASITCGIYVITVSEGEKGLDMENTRKNNGWKCPHLIKSINSHIHEAQQTPSRISIFLKKPIKAQHNQITEDQ